MSELKYWKTVEKSRRERVVGGKEANDRKKRRFDTWGRAEEE